MLNIVIFGPPGAGKGTQAKKIAQQYRLVHLSTGDIFRANIKKKTPLGKLAQSYTDKGELVPDEVTIRMLESELNRHKSPRGIIFDGFPRTIAQAEALDNFLEDRGTAITIMLALEVHEEELISRIKSRALLEGRKDDADETVIKNRILEYNNKTAPLKDYYSLQGKSYPVQGVGTIDDIFHGLCEVIEQHLPKADDAQRAAGPDAQTSNKRSPRKPKKKVKKSPARKSSKKAGKKKSAKKPAKRSSKKRSSKKKRK